MREAFERVWEKIHTTEKEDAIQLVTLDRALGLRFLSLLECQLFISLAPLELAHHSPASESPLPDRRCRWLCEPRFAEREQSHGKPGGFGVARRVPIDPASN